MTTTTSALGSVTQQDSSRTVNKSLTALGGEDFLQMLITQRKYQDPTNPMDNKEVLEQLTSLRTLDANSELAAAI